jgi:hypothetical protein
MKRFPPIPIPSRTEAEYQQVLQLYEQRTGDREEQVVEAAPTESFIGSNETQAYIRRASELGTDGRAAIKAFFEAQGIAKLSDLPVSLVPQFEQVLANLELRGVAAKAA